MISFNKNMKVHFLLKTLIDAAGKKVLPKQIGKSLPLDNYCMDDHLSAGNKIFNPIGAMCIF